MTDTSNALPETSPDAATATAPPPSAKPGNNTLRKRMFLIFGAVIAVAALGWGAWTLIEGGRWVSTDNAYVEASSATITPLVSGAIKEVRIANTQVVRTGDILVILDDTDAKLALAQAEAQLDLVTRQVTGYYANDAQLAAQSHSASAQVANAAAAVERARKAYEDRAALAGTGAVAGEDLQAAKTALDQAEATYAAARSGVEAANAARNANAAMIGDTSAQNNPQVVAARARVEQARLDYERTVIRSPIDGVVAQNSVEIGARVQTGAPLMKIVPIQSAYVNANYKEVQLEHVREGQSVELTADVYGHDVKYHGKVVGVAGGTGSAFSVIPAQNATGNWIKVVQRIPVKIALDPAELTAHPLRVGMSMEAKIRVKP